MKKDLFFKYEDKTYPSILREGFHSQYIFPIAKKYCTGKVLDVGGNNNGWAFPNSQLCDQTQPPPWNDGTNIPANDETFDSIFSSHTLEHIPYYIKALEEWKRVLKKGGVLFLYLPSVDEVPYWRPINDRRHCNIIRPVDLRYDLEKLEFENIFISGTDLAGSYSVLAIKA